MQTNAKSAGLRLFSHEKWRSIAEGYAGYGYFIPPNPRKASGSEVAFSTMDERESS